MIILGDAVAAYCLLSQLPSCTSFKSAALTASRCEPFKTWYSELLARGLRPELARVTMARKIAAITLAVWKAGEDFDGSKVIEQVA